MTVADASDPLGELPVGEVRKPSLPRSDATLAAKPFWSVELSTSTEMLLGAIDTFAAPPDAEPISLSWLSAWKSRFEAAGSHFTTLPTAPMLKLPGSSGTRSICTCEGDMLRR